MSEKKDLIINPKFEPLFIDEIDTPRYYNVYGGRGSGKSFAVAIASVKLTYSKYEHKILYLRQTMSSSEDSTVADIKLAIKTMGLEEDFKEVKGNIYNLVTGASIIFKGIRSTGSQTAKLKSLSGITTLVIEEAEEVQTFNEFSKIDEGIRIKGKPLKIILVYNPTTVIKNWIHDQWFIKGRPNRERFHDTVYIHTTYLENLDNLPESVIQRYEDLKTINPVYYRNTILAEWTLEANDRIYGGWGITDSFNEECDTWYGLDFGYGGKDKTSCVKIMYFDKAYYIELMFSEAKMTIQKTVSSMREARIPHNAKIYADSAMPLIITEIRNKGYQNIRKCSKGKVTEGVKKIQDKNIIYVGDQKDHLFDSYMTFSTNKKGELPHEPDELAAVRYGINSKVPLDNTKKSSNIKRRLKRKGFL